MARLFYFRLPEFWRKEEKLDFLSDNTLSTVDWRSLAPNHKHTWLRTDTEDEFDAFIPIGSKEAKRAKPDQPLSIFSVHSMGIQTARDAYVLDFQEKSLLRRIEQLVFDYNSQVDSYKRQRPTPNVDDFVDYERIPWSSTLKVKLRGGNYADYAKGYLRTCLYRPFTKKTLYYSDILIHRPAKFQTVFPDEYSEAENRVICISGVGHEVFRALSANRICEVKFSNPSNGGTQCFPFYTYDEDGSNRRENITDLALDQFRDHYKDPAISKWDIFYYVYGLLHHPGYRERYALDLKRNLPRIPFAPTPGPFPEASGKGGTVASAKSLPEASGRDFGWGWQKGGFRPFSRAGQQLADLHLNYESVDRYELDWHAERTPPSYRVEKMLPKGKTDSEQGNYKVYSTL